MSDEDLIREMRERGPVHDEMDSAHHSGEQPTRKRRNEHYVSEDGDVEYHPFQSDGLFEGIEIRGLNSYYERLGIPRPQYRRPDIVDGDGSAWSSDVNVDGFDRGDASDLDLGGGDADWDRDEAVAAAQANLRLMREEDLNYAMDSIEAEILNMDHAPSEDELVAIADRAADAYDMSEDYQDY